MQPPRPLHKWWWCVREKKKNIKERQCDGRGKEKKKRGNRATNKMKWRRDRKREKKKKEKEKTVIWKAKEKKTEWKGKKEEKSEYEREKKTTRQRDRTRGKYGTIRPSRAGKFAKFLKPKAALKSMRPPWPAGVIPQRVTRTPSARPMNSKLLTDTSTVGGYFAIGSFPEREVGTNERFRARLKRFSMLLGTSSWVSVIVADYSEIALYIKRVYDMLTCNMLFLSLCV